MKKLFILTGIVIFFLLAKPQCAKDQAEHECELICNDIGYDAGPAKETGYFTYKCMCRSWTSYPELINKP